MAMQLMDDFREFLKLLNSNGVDYLLIGGYAVGVHGYVRATGDMDIWIRRSPENARRVETALLEFGFAVPSLSSDLFLAEDNVVRMCSTVPSRSPHNNFGCGFRRMFP